MQEILEFLKSNMPKYHYNKFFYVFDFGKRLRPNLMKSVCSEIDKDFLPLIPAASSIELMHCATLVHDDVIDKSPLRRNNFSFFKKYGIKSAILHGDLFGLKALEIISDKYNKLIYLEVIRTFRTIVEGQLMELENKLTDFDSYIEYIEKKTASLFVASAKIPMLYYKMHDENILKFSELFGITYQVANDLKKKKNEIGILSFISKNNAESFLKEKIKELKGININLPDIFTFSPR